MLVFCECCPKPYVRMTQRSMHVDPQAQQYLASKTAMGSLMKIHVDDGMIPRGKPLAVRIRIEHGHGFHNRDLDNEVKAILDAAQGIVFEDDRWVDSIEADRCQVDDTCLVALKVDVL